MAAEVQMTEEEAQMEGSQHSDPPELKEEEDSEKTGEAEDATGEKVFMQKVMKHREQLEELKQQYQEAINKMNFADAESLKMRIAKATKVVFNDDASVVVDFFLQEVESVKKVIAKKRSVILQTFTDKEIEIRQSLGEKAQEMMKAQTSKLLSLEETMFQQYKQTQTQSIDGYEELLSRAKAAAKRGEFDLASELKQQAEGAKDSQIKKRDEVFLANYNMKFANLLQKQKLSADSLVNRLETQLIDLEKQKQTSLSSLVLLNSKYITSKYKSIVDYVSSTNKTKPENFPDLAINSQNKPIILSSLSSTYQSLLSTPPPTKQPKYNPKSLAGSDSPNKYLSVLKQSPRTKPRNTQ